MIKIGNIELQDWIVPIINGVPYHTPYRMPLGAIFNVFERPRTYVIINCSGPYNFWPEFHGDLSFLEGAYQPKDFSSYDEAKEYTDNFLQRMSRLTAFV